MDLQDVQMGAAAIDKITRAKGTVTAKLERMSGSHSVCLEGLDSTGRAFESWTDLDRLQIVASA